MTSYLITGGAGFIGSHLCEALVNAGDECVVLDDLSTGISANLVAVEQSTRLRFVHGSVLDELAVDDLVHKVDAVVHLAAAVGVRLIIEQPLRSLRTNIRGSEIVFEAAHRHRKKILLASTSEVYGKSPDIPLSEDADRVLGSPRIARWAYSTAKTVDEILAYAYEKDRGLDAIVVRLFNTIGPRQTAAYGMVVPRLVDQALSDRPLTVFGDGLQTRCFCHVHDVVDAIVLLLRYDRTGESPFNVGSQEEVSILDLAKRIRILAGSSSTIEFVPYDTAYETGFEDMQRRVPDTGKIAAAVGWKATHTLDQTLVQIIDHIRLRYQ